MRKLAGSVFFLAGIGGLGAYATFGPAAVVQEKVASAAASVAQTALHGVTATVVGRDITLSGTVNDAGEQAALLSALQAIPGARVVALGDVTTLPWVSPYTLTAVKDAAGVQAQGYAPTGASVTALGIAGLTVAAGAPETGWDAAVRVGLDALDLLDTGSLILADTGLVVEGLAANPTAQAAFEAALDSLPVGYTAVTNVTLADDGTPLRLALQYDGQVLRGSGKIPADIAPSELTIDGAMVALDLTQAALPSEQGAWPVAAAQATAALSHLIGGMLTLDGETVALSGVASPDGIARANQALADLPEGFIAESSLTLFDDGEPFHLVVEKTDTGHTLSGKIPADFDPDSA